ncbi:MAG: hypothetical protein HYZ33_01545 [Ignavibacteriales bacterium]|nr:hypothetical protein [Ignavibacteriales bacterium]
MQFTAIFESWHIGDGNYPPLYRGKLVNLSFELELKILTPTSNSNSEKFEQVIDAEYSFVGNILRLYDQDDDPFFVIQANEMIFYTTGDLSGYDYLLPGTKVSGYGTLLLDHYRWVEFLSEYTEPPNLFYTLRVDKIQKVQMPEKYIYRDNKSKSVPTRLHPSEYPKNNVAVVETMEGQRFDEEFYIIDFSSISESNRVIPKTFLGKTS